MPMQRKPGGPMKRERLQPGERSAAQNFVAQSLASQSPQLRRLRASAVIPANLRFEAITRRFGTKNALEDFSFTAKSGEVIGLLGPSGCGKSTLLRLAAGIDCPDKGAIFLDDTEISGPNVYVPPERRGIGLVFQDYALFPHLDALHNVMFGLKGLPRREAMAIADAALSRVGLDTRMRAMPHELSGGEQQRVALARALVPRPQVLLMDEPFSNLDRRMRDFVREETLALLRETGATALIVTHDPEEAMRLADRIVLMRAGRLVQAGTSEELYARPVDLDTARFFCDFNEMTGVVLNGQVATELGALPVAGHGEGARVIIAVRPQAFCLVDPPPIGKQAVAEQGEITVRVVDRRFVGEAVMLQLAVQGSERLFQARMPQALWSQAGSGQHGQDGIYRMRIRMEDVLAFARE